MNLLIKDESSQYYKTGFSCDNAIVLSFGEEHLFITDSRYTVEAAESVNKQTGVIEAADLVKTARQLIRKYALRSLVYDPLEWRAGDFKKLSEKLPRVNFKAKEGRLAAMRAVKTDDEIALLKRAAEIGADAFDRFAVFLSENSRTLTEKNLFFKATEILTAFGERPVSFEPILAINANAAKPHALPTDTRLQNGDLLLMDAGVKHERYCSDRTRTAPFENGLNFTRQQHFKDAKIQKVYDLVLKAHDEAIRLAKPGMKACELDAVARNIIDMGGYGERFIHSLGHGVGLDIHEHPYINKRNDVILEENMVFTIEPGIYLPGEFGIRIEDTVVLKADGAHIL